MDDTEQLRDLHDHYVWEVNAAVGEGRVDLVWQLADEYLDAALRLVTDGEPAECERPGCAVCQRPRAPIAPSSRRRWRFLTRNADAS